MPSLSPLVSALALLACAGVAAQAPAAGPYFNRVATFEAHRNVPTGRAVSKKSVAEIVAVSADGMTLAYTDGEQMGIGLIDIRNPAQPQPAGFLPVEGEPTSVTIAHGKVLAAVNSTKDFAQPTGHLAVFDLASRKALGTCPLFGQPDSIALDPGARHAVIVMENERDEKFNKGAIPQLPGGNLTIVPLSAAGLPDCTRSHPVALNGLADIAPDDAEPELVKVNAQGIAVVTLQENNHIVLIDVAKRQVIKHFSAGAVDLKDIDRTRDGTINPSESAKGLLREPDAVAWLDNTRFVTANEGDYKGGSRSISIFNTDGKGEWDSGNFLDHEAMRLGHYPEGRSAAKGNEPEGVEVGVFGKDTLIFVGSERSSLVTVWRDRGAGKAPEYLQALPAGSGPEGLVAIPRRGLLVVASENDGAARASVMIYQRGAAVPAYPTLMSSDSPAGPPIPWGAISGTAADRTQAGRLFAVTDSVYATTRILQIDTNFTPALISNAMTVTKDGKPVGYDGEGIVQRADGGFWLASEGDPDKKPAPLRNLLLRLNAKAEVQEEIALPEALARHATRFGFEGVTTTGTGDQEVVWLAVQRAWKDDPKGVTKILRYSPATKTWGVLHYPLETTKAEGGWVGLSEITAVGPDTFVVVERDNQFGDQSLKTLHTFSVAGLAAAAPGDANVPVVTKRLLRNLVPDLQQPHGYVLDKVESFAVDRAGQAFAITDNDGVDGSNGETQFLRLGSLPGLR
ncbi:MAG: alkaline phosphatase [Curvibacter sp. RIFCSPHIGHO2_12_FULL_63_18]|uniref:esterase-like activity of phytase family protein n=1 Tax=Rhodoferax sp. TaxID=50421 RepID=UPI0008ACA5C8|nr:esterase-like activity of phytase family protein [Rhodoferax sp.]OGO97277.1 MAG: alkaline phosphatase [Curvibacter sp. GWA2_63_95]OGP02431.1 MAG: alkaline phosphatase [Curvibacter sp. RIFCSPHIGHO2_12_FULL_63_18]HCX81704.1 alkaline phosphatase [Rhodoferax sp.]